MRTSFAPPASVTSSLSTLTDRLKPGKCAIPPSVVNWMRIRFLPRRRSPDPHLPPTLLNHVLFLTAEPEEPAGSVKRQPGKLPEPGVGSQPWITHGFVPD